MLNRSWLAISVTSVRQAIRMIVNGAAKVVDPETTHSYDFGAWIVRPPYNGSGTIRTVRLQVPVPEVIVLSRYAGRPIGRVVFTRRNLYRRDRYTCQYCGTKPGPSGLTMDHVIPRARGGKATWENCVLACVSCNKKKGDRSLAEARMPLLSKPARPGGNLMMLLPTSRRRNSWERFVPDLFRVETEPGDG